ncbi:MAG: hypothetical protein Q9160_000617 [Pyrenula sp. 1 TL-2023]
MNNSLPHNDGQANSEKTPAPSTTSHTSSSSSPTSSTVNSPSLDEKQMPPEASLPADGGESQSPAPKPSPPPYTAFPPARRTFILTVTTIAGFFGPLAGNIYLPALPVLERAFGVGSTAINVTVSVFMVVFAFGPLFWSSLADWKGRRPLYIISIALYILANILLAALPANYGSLVFLRILQAFGSSAVVSMGAGTVADIVEPKKRARAMSYFLLGPQCGPVLGPVIGGALTGETSWRWIFGFLAVSGFALWLLILLSLPETLRARVGNGRIDTDSRKIFLPPRLFSDLAPESERGPPPPKPTLLGYYRLFTYPPIGIVSFNTAILYSAYFCIAVQLPSALEDVYGWSSSEVGAGYLAVGIAMIAGSMTGGRFSDWRRKVAVKARGEENITPENRLIDQIWGVFPCVAGTIMFGWFVDKKIHPAAVIVATFLTGFGMSFIFVASNAFLTECVPQQAAGAFALGNMLRNPAAAVAAAIIHTLVSSMGWGWCFSGLGLLEFWIVGGAILVLRWKSPAWRARRKERMEKAKEKEGEKKAGK